MPSASADGQTPVSIYDAIDALRRASGIPAKQRATKVAGVVTAICSHAFSQGLDAIALRAVTQVVSRKTELDQSSVTNLVKNLYPAQLVPSDIVVAVVAALGQGKGKPSPSTQNGLLKWLLAVHDIVEDPGILSRLYRVLFGMLDMISIRTPLCHLLSLITRRKHVKPFRIQQLLELSRGLGNEPALQGLIRVYKDYYPDIILGTTAKSRNSFPPRPDQEWLVRIRSIHEKSTASHGPNLEPYEGFRVLRNGPRKNQASVIPDVHTIRANETSVTLEEIDSVEDFAENLDRIEPPAQMISFLNDPLLQKFVALNPSSITSNRITLWLSISLEVECNTTSSPNTGGLADLLDGLARQAQYSKELLPVVSIFLREYILLWDGVTAARAIFDLLSYIPIQQFQDAYATYLQPAEHAVLRLSCPPYQEIILLYTGLLRHWMAETILLQANEPQPVALQALADLVAHACNLSTSLLLSLPNSSDTPLVSSVLTFIELLSLSSQPNLIPIILPPTHLSYLLAQSPSITTLSRLSTIYANYKTAFDRHPHPIASYYPQSTIDTFNASLRDLYYLLWGSKALLSIPNQATGFFVAGPVRETLHYYLSHLDRNYTIGASFDLSHNAVIAACAVIAWRSLEEVEIEREGYDRDSVNFHKGPITSRSLDVLKVNRGVNVGWETYKVHVLQWLADRGCAGIRDLMFATHAKLKKFAAKE